ncbi:TFIIH/NER complex subunit [Vermiconidia calcicola]|uniref:TFIIH/NER complex subunit n=1 Tax=Vermiconidia calcicola TaxID=1690605 RepID=A0ACC3N1E1_9PEZI|nr:TFIIH/NER complex subunit [Vermiconidia calcicola]
MSRLAQPKPIPLPKRSGGGDAQDVCESCVDRIFSHGPSQCPIPGCRKTLRKHRFREQTFEDIQVEREVDIRKRVAAVFNRREDDFESLRDYNDYLNEVEDITFNLINNIDLEDTQKKFDKYQAAHEEEIMENASLAEKERMQFAAGQKAEREQAKQRRDAARREEAEEKREVLEGKKDVLNRLASGQDAESVAQEGQKVQLKKRMDRAAAAERQRQLQQQTASAPSGARNGSSNLVIKGLKAKTKKTAEPEAPIDPFGGLSFEGRKYYSLQDDYVWVGVQETKTDALIGAGGYDVSSFTSRALCEAFAGLGVFVGEEMEGRERREEDGNKVVTKGAELVAQGREKKVKIEDPF